MSEFQPFRSADVAARTLTEVADGNPEGHTVKDHADKEPRVNTLVVCGDLLEDLTESAHDAIEANDETAHDVAMAARDQVIIIHADALRSDDYAAAVWQHITTRDADEVPA